MTAFKIGLIVSIILNAVLAYRVLDLGVTTTYQSDEIKRQAATLSNASKLLPSLLPKISRANLLAKGKQSGLTVFEKPEEHSIYIGGIIFIMDAGFVKTVDFDG